MEVRVFPHACVSRAPSLGILIFCFHNLHRRVAFTVKIPCSLSGSWMNEFPNFWALVEHLLAMFSVWLMNFVPNRAVIIWIWLFYREFCEGCESKKLKIAVGARIRAREGALFSLPDVRWTPSFFLLGFRARFLVILALELLCGEAVCLTQIPDWDLMKITNFVRLLIASSSKGWKNRATYAEKTPTFFGKSPTFFQKRGRFSLIARTFLSGGLQYSFLQHLLRGFYLGIKGKALRLKGAYWSTWTKLKLENNAALCLYPKLVIRAL